MFLDISKFKIKELSKGNLYFVTSKDLRQIGASQFKEGDIINVSGKYYIHIEYGEYDIPSLNTWIEDSNFKAIDCTPGSSYGFTPYYIDDFKSR